MEPETHVPTSVFTHIQQQTETAEDRIRTAHVVPESDRLGTEGEEGATIEEVVAELSGVCQGNTDESSGFTERHPRGDLEEVLDEHISTRTFEMASTGMFALDNRDFLTGEAKVQFIVEALENERGRQDLNLQEGETRDIRLEEASNHPFIRVSRGNEFADSLDVDFFTKTFPTLFPFGRGGPRTERPDSTIDEQNCSLKYWASTLLKRHGGRFATHPIFPFLVFNILVRSSNRRISNARMTRSTFAKLERLYESLTQERLRAALDEFKETGRTTDNGVQLLLRELSIFGYSQPLSNDTRLQMRRKIKSLCIAIGLPAIWFTINPNDIVNPIKIRLAVFRNHTPEVAKQLLEEVRLNLQAMARSINDPVSAVEFFRREVTLFFQHFVKPGQESIFGKVSHYYAAIETNERGALHLHGLMWWAGNLQLHTLGQDFAGPEGQEYRDKVTAFVDDIFSETLDENQGREIRRTRKVTDEEPRLVNDMAYLDEAFDAEANFVAYCCQIHSHSATCVKYSIKDIATVGLSLYKKLPCRFKAPWRLIDRTHYTTDGVLEVKRDHPLVNRYNPSMAIALKHNHDITMILSKKQGLALVYYMTNYATKLHTPMWQRIAIAADVYQQLQAREPEAETREDLGPKSNKTRQFLMRLANRVFTDRELSSVEVINHLFGYETDYTNVSEWTYLHLNTLYWAVAKQWCQLQEAIAEHRGVEQDDETVQVRRMGFQLWHIEAYKYRGPLLRDMCLYDYMSLVQLTKPTAMEEDESLISFDERAEFGDTWMQRLRKPGERAVVVFTGELSDKLRDEHVVFYKR